MRRSIVGHVVSFATLAIVGCGGDSITGPGGGFDARAAADLVDAAVRHESGNLATGHVGLVVQAVREAPAASVNPGPRDRIEWLSGPGDFRLGGRLERAVRPVLSMTGRNGILPDGVLGKTFTLAGEAAEGYDVDEAATDAPADGARFRMYELDRMTGGPEPVPPSYAGHLDLQEPVPGDGLEIHARDTGGEVLFDATVRRHRTSGDDVSSSTLASAGRLGMLDYTLRDHVAFSGGFARADFAFERDLRVGADVHITYEASGHVSSGESGRVRIVATVESAGRTVVVDTVDDGESVVGNVVYDGRLAVTVSGDSIDPTFAGPDGTPLAGGELEGMRQLWLALDLALHFGDELLIPLSSLMS